MTRLGELERAVMDHLWAAGEPQTVRQVHEALSEQRDLAYTSMSIKQVAHGLGFGDAGYFTRFFQRLTGQTPSAWRARSAAAAAASCRKGMGVVPAWLAVPIISHR